VTRRRARPRAKVTSPTPRAKAAQARACANIALAKYWGKSDVELNLPAVPSISLTLDRLVTDTHVAFDPSLASDAIVIDGAGASRTARARVIEMLDRVRARAGIETRARVETANAFPTAAGLASSASGFAALAAAATAAAGLDVGQKELSRIARRSSASAARSIWGGFVKLPAGVPGDTRLAARPLFDAAHWDVALVVAIAAAGPKDVGSTEGMERSRRTSPYYDAWIDAAPRLARAIERGIAGRDLERVGRAMEQSTLAFHACALASDPAILYWQPATVALLRAVRSLREDRGIPVFATMDAGPHVKALCLARDAARVRAALRRAAGVVEVFVARPGPGVEVRA
jgi:diphosphomevalonate decarboxylase